MTLQPGAQLAGYRIESLLGRGGMGAVYLATDERLGRKVALKILTPALADDAAFRDRFVAESRVAASLDHPNVVPVFEAGEVDGRLFIAMRYVDGTDLARLIEDRGPLPLDLALRVVEQVAGALDAAHAAGLVHRDVKPGNVLLTDTEGGVHAYLVDFGLTKQVGGGAANMTRTGQFVGSIEYVAPEQIEGRGVDARTDVYALGCLAYECLAGVPPFHRTSEMATLTAHIKDPPPSLLGSRPDLPGGMDQAIGRALAKDPEARFPSAGAFAHALAAAASADAAADVARGLLVAELKGRTRTADAEPPGAGPGPDPPEGETLSLGAPQAPADARSIEVFRRIVRDAISRHGGAEIERDAQTVAAVFPTVDQALACAMTVSAATRAQAAADPDAQLEVAVGVHADVTSEVPPASLASLVGVTHGIASQAAPGEVMASDTVVRQARTSTRIAYGRRTQRRIDGLAEPLGVVRVESGVGTQQAESGRRRLVVVALVAGVAAVAVLAWLGASGGIFGSASPSPSGSVAAVPTPTATPEIVERIAYASELVFPDTESCTRDSGFAEAHLALVSPDGRPDLAPRTDLDTWARAPDWSADGAMLTFWGTLQSGDDVPFVAAATGERDTQLAANDPNAGGLFYGAIRPAISPDGSQIAIAKDGSLIVIDADDRALTTVLGAPWGSLGVEPAPTPMGSGPAVVNAVDWLPDGRLALMSGDEIWTTTADGSQAPRSGSLPSMVVSEPSWAPDGSRIAFQSQPLDQDGGATAAWDIYVVDADGTGLVQLTSDPANDIHPAWSPDGGRIAFASDRDGGYEIQTMNADGTQTSQITESPEGFVACWPAWGRTTTADLPQPTPSPEPGATPAPGILHRGVLDAGTYVSDDLSVPTQLTLGEGWTGYIATPDEISVQDSDDRFTELTVARLQTGYDPPCYTGTEGASPPELKLLGPEPRDVIEHIAGQPILDASEPQPVNLGGVTGLQIDVTPAGPLADVCPDPIGNRLHLFQAGGDSVWVRDGQKVRIIALDVRGTTVTIVAGAPAAAFGESMARLQPTIDSLAFPE